MDPILYIERGLDYQYRKNWGRLIFIWSLLFLSLAITSIVLNMPAIYPISFEILFLLFLCTYIANSLMKTLFLHLYKERIQKNKGMTYEVLMAEEKARFHNDDVRGLINSRYGDEVMKRLGITRTSLEDYLNKRRFSNRINKENYKKQKMDLPSYLLIIHDNDSHFASYLRTQRILRDDLMKAGNFVQNLSSLDKSQDRLLPQKAWHDLSPFEIDAINIEKAHDVYFTHPVLNKLSLLDDDEKFKILKNVIEKAKNQKKKNILISDIYPQTATV